MKYRKLIAAVFLWLSLFVGPAQAIIPENGWWWNAGESGRGFNLEIQNNLLFFSAFAYDSVGNPSWYVSGGQMVDDSYYSGAILQFTGGQCFGCPYTAPVSFNVGTLTLNFSSSKDAIMTAFGVTVPVERFDFWKNAVLPDAMLGEWSTTEGDPSLPAYFGERIIFNQLLSDAAGYYVSGGRTGALITNTAVGSFDAYYGWSMVLDSSSSYFHLYTFTRTGFNRLEGNQWVYLKGSIPAGPGTFFLAYRTKSAARVMTGSGPGASKMAVEQEADPALTTRMNQAALQADLLRATLNPSANAAPPETIEMARRLEALLAARKKSVLH